MAMYAGIPNDPRLNEHPATTAVLDEATRVAMEAGQAPSSLTQRADEIARAEEAKFNTDLANKYAQAEIWTPVIQNMMAQSQPQQPQTERQAPVLTQGLMPGFGEGATYQAGYIPGQEQAQPQQPQTLTQMARQKALDIIYAKNLYAQGEAMGGEQGAKAMQLAHAGAERARADLQQLGVDPAQYGLNGTYEEAAQGLANNDIRAMQNTLEGEWAESSGSYYDRVYKILRDNGFSSDIAEAEAHRRAESYASRRVQALNQAFNTYGHNGQVINPMGIQMLGMMAQEDTDMANYYTQRYAGPLQEYAKQNARENAAIQHGYKKEDMAIGQQYDLQKMDKAQQDRIQMANINAEIQEAHANNDVVRAVQKAGALYSLQAKYGIGKGAKNANGISDTQAKQAAEMIKQIDTKLKDGLDLSDAEKAQLNADRAKYQSVVDAYIGFGQQSGQGDNGAWAEYGDVPNDYEAFGRWVEAMFDKNRQEGYPRTNEQIIAIAEGVNKQFADNYIDDSYRKPVQSTAGNSTAVTARSYPAVNVTVDNGDYGLEGGQRGNMANIFGNWHPTISRGTGDSELARTIRASRGLS